MPRKALEKVQPRSKGILLKAVPYKLHKRMKLAAATQDKTLIEWSLDAFEFYLRNGRRLPG
ncbi:hypothetical protein ES703_96121 [subsurface metagenome]